ncbi:hypothetical protein LAY23_17670, partial [Escherichia coli]|nr:hypothetical protein [Escherichia coli]
VYCKMSVGSTHHLEMVFVWKQNYILVDEYFFFCCTWIVNSAHKHSRCEVISGVTLPLIEQMMACRETMTSSEFRERIVELGAPEVSSLWHQQQKNPPFVLKHNLYEY